MVRTPARWPPVRPPRPTCRDAQLAVEESQAGLAGLIGLATADAAPLTTDRPHVGGYRTEYTEQFPGQAPPVRMQLIHRTLPLRRKAIDAHGEAVVAALDSVTATSEQVPGAGGLATLLDALELLNHERRAFINAVRTYNLDIAEYAFTVAPAGAPSETLVSMLIRTSSPPPSSSGGAGSGGSLQKTFRRDTVPSTSKPDTLGHGASTTDPDDWTANYHGQLGDAAADDPALYRGLIEMTSEPLRVQKLGNLLHWDRSLPEGAGQPLSLAEALATVPTSSRLAAITAYWQARQCAARLQVQSDQLEQLNALQAIAIPQRDTPGMAEAGVRLHAARRAARAATVDAERALAAAQFELMRATGRPLSGAWVMPSTPPQSGATSCPPAPGAVNRPGHAGPSAWRSNTTSCTIGPIRSSSATPTARRSSTRPGAETRCRAERR